MRFTEYDDFDHWARENPHELAEKIVEFMPSPPATITTEALEDKLNAWWTDQLLTEMEEMGLIKRYPDGMVYLTDYGREWRRQQ